MTLYVQHMHRHNRRTTWHTISQLTSSTLSLFSLNCTADGDRRSALESGGRSRSGRGGSSGVSSGRVGRALLRGTSRPLPPPSVPDSDLSAPAAVWAPPSSASPSGPSEAGRSTLTSGGSGLTRIAPGRAAGCSRASGWGGSTGRCVTGSQKVCMARSRSSQKRNAS